MKLGFCASLWLVLAGATEAQVTQRASLNSAGEQANYDCKGPSISPDGRYVVFYSGATNLAPNSTFGFNCVFLRDRLVGTTERVSVNLAGGQPDAESHLPSVSADGRWVAFVSWATDLVPGDTNGVEDAFVRDRLTGTTERVSVSSSGAEANNWSDWTYGSNQLSADGRCVVFESPASNLVPGDTGGFVDVFVRDRLAGTTERVSVATGGAQASGASWNPALSTDGRFVVFVSNAPNLVPNDTNGHDDVFLHDRVTGTTERVTLDSAGGEANDDSFSPSVSADGRYVAFSSFATNLVPGDTNAAWDTFVRDRATGTTERVSVSSGGAQGNADSLGVSISADGRSVVFVSSAANLVPGDTNGAPDVFVRDRIAGTTERVSISSAGVQGDLESGFWGVSISQDGRFASFSSDATTLVPGDTANHADIFVRDRLVAPDSSSLCDPGTNGVIGCPCSNPPGSPGRGCDNSASTGGALLLASGGTYLSSDTLDFSTNGERSTALSILLQGNSRLSQGAVYGQGVRCVGGTLRRLFSKTASGGSITAPDFGSGDPTVSARSAALGEVIQPAQSRWYLVYYRDPAILGGCPASATFNSTQTVRTTWWP
jgi:Tol biopolymer transport system component